MKRRPLKLPEIQDTEQTPLVPSLLQIILQQQTQTERAARGSDPEAEGGETVKPVIKPSKMDTQTEPQELAQSIGRSRPLIFKALHG
jgi:hypothetical protein